MYKQRVESQSKGSDLRRSVSSRFWLLLSQSQRCRQRALNLASRFEGGQFFSYTAREIMRRHFGVTIGAYSYGGCFAFRAFQAPVIVGRYVSIGPDVRVYRRDHPTNNLSTHPFFYNADLGFLNQQNKPLTPLEIEHDVWIGANVLVTPGCSRIGLGSIVGAGAVITKDVPDFTIVAGVPARPIRQRFSEKLCRQIRDSKWWFRSIDECIPHMESMRLALLDEPSDHPLLQRDHFHVIGVSEVTRAS